MVRGLHALSLLGLQRPPHDALGREEVFRARVRGQHAPDHEPEPPLLGEVARSAFHRTVKQDGRRDADVEALHEPPHGDAHAPRAGLRELSGYPVPLVAQDETEPGDGREIFWGEIAVGVGRDELESLSGEPSDRRWHAPVRVHIDPLVGASRHVGGREERHLTFDDVEIGRTERVERADDGAAVVGIVRGVHQHGHGGHAVAEDPLEPGAPGGLHEPLQASEEDAGIVAEVARLCARPGGHLLDTGGDSPHRGFVPRRREGGVPDATLAQRDAHEAVLSSALRASPHPPGRPSRGRREQAPAPGSVTVTVTAAGASSGRVCGTAAGGAVDARDQERRGSGSS